MKKLRIYLFLLVTIMASSTKAEGVKYLIFNNDGEESVIALADEPEMTISDGILKLTVLGEEKLSVELSEGLSYKFSETVPTSIQKVLDEESTRLQSGHVYFVNSQKGEVVRVFNTRGQLLATQRVGEDGTADVNLTSLSKGILIVKSSKTSIKVMNK